MRRFLQALFGHRDPAPDAFEVWRHEEERRQMQQVREQLDRTERMVVQLDRRREPQRGVTE